MINEIRAVDGVAFTFQSRFRVTFKTGSPARDFRTCGDALVGGLLYAVHIASGRGCAAVASAGFRWI